jgi:predicted DsbA family dithiol-disulfide isomerase
LLLVSFLLQPSESDVMRHPRSWSGARLALVLVLLSGCGGRDAATAQLPQGAAPEPTVVAEVGGQPITMEQLGVADEIRSLELQYLRARSNIIEQALNNAIGERLLAAEAQRRGTSVDEMISAEATGGIVPSDDEVASWYDANRARLGGRSLEELRGQIAQHLAEQRVQAARRNLDARLRAEHGVTIHYTTFRIPFDNDGAPSLGPAHAPVTLVEFSDFQCPFCARVVPTLKQVHETFGNDVRIVFRQFPIPQIHPYAMKAAEASLCAHEQSKFWAMHDAMFAQQNQLAVSDLKQLAGRTGLNQRRFDTCLDSGRFAEQVQNDMREGQLAGVTGTPALFLNGRPLEGGAVPYEVLEQAIRMELASQNR